MQITYTKQNEVKDAAENLQEKKWRKQEIRL